MSLKMRDRVDNGIWVYIGSDIYANAFENRAWEPGEYRYSISRHHGETPAFTTSNFSTIEELLSAMREITDLRYWKDCE